MPTTITGISGLNNLTLFLIYFLLLLLVKYENNNENGYSRYSHILFLYQLSTTKLVETSSSYSGKNNWVVVDFFFSAWGESSNLFLYNEWYIDLLSNNSLWDPDSTISPLSKTIIFDAFSIVDNLCAITIVVLFVINFSNASCTINSDSVSNAEVASSKMIIGESL